MSPELERYQKTGDSIALVSRYRKLIVQFARLSKADYPNKNSQWRWFYGLFLDGQPRTQANLLAIEDAVQLATYWLTYKDCYNQTVSFFLQLAGKYQPSKDNRSFQRYIRMVLGWRLKHWVFKHIKDHRESVPGGAIFNSQYYVEASNRPPDIQPFSMNIKWILTSGHGPMFKKLSSYDRYLLYLYFVEGYTMKQIAEKTCKSKNTINKDIRRVLTRCRQNSKE